jgi:hypothetical protein
MPKDQFGIKIKEGTRVCLTPPEGIVTGVVTRIDDGRVAVQTAGSHPRPGHMVIMIDIHVMWNPAQGDTIGNVMVVAGQPEAEELSGKPDEPKQVN